MVLDCGDDSDEVFVIVEGAVRIVLRTVFGYEAILNDQAAGEFFGELAAIDGVRRSANVTALLRTRLCVLTAEDFIHLATSSPTFGRRLLSLLSARLRAKDERLVEFGALTVRQRIFAELLRLSRDRGSGERVLSPPPPQHVLAARIGTRRESVSRVLAEMAFAGLATVSRRAIVLHHPEQLREEVETRLRGKGLSWTASVAGLVVRVSVVDGSAHGAGGGRFFVLLSPPALFSFVKMRKLSIQPKPRVSRSPPDWMVDPEQRVIDFLIPVLAGVAASHA
jgi:CRP/FNR family cyclic AMP-dependent transcriptional regulator